MKKTTKISPADFTINAKNIGGPFTEGRGVEAPV